MEEIFTNIYENSMWGTNNNSEYKGSSGSGSEIDYNKNTYIPFIQKFILDNKIKTIVDLGCGDFKCGPLIYDNLDILYTGYDAYNKIIQYNSKQHSISKYNFIHLDFYNKKENIINSDLCILKDVLQHWKMNEIYLFLDYLIDTKKFKYILLCNCCNQKENDPINNDRSTPLSINFLPLKKYNPVKLYTFHSKEISVITI